MYSKLSTTVASPCEILYELLDHEHIIRHEHLVLVGMIFRVVWTVQYKFTRLLSYKVYFFAKSTGI